MPSKGAEVILSNGEKFESPKKWTLAKLVGDRWFVGNFNNDKKTDVFRFLHNLGGVDMFESTGADFQ